MKSAETPGPYNVPRKQARRGEIVGPPIGTCSAFWEGDPSLAKSITGPAFPIGAGDQSIKSKFPSTPRMPKRPASTTPNSPPGMIARKRFKLISNWRKNCLATQPQPREIGSPSATEVLPSRDQRVTFENAQTRAVLESDVYRFL